MASVSGEFWELDGRSVAVTHLDKDYWPEDGLTKGDMLRYYREISPVLLSYLRDHPVTLRVFPDGVRGPGYFRRDCPANAPVWLRGVEYRPESTDRTIQAPLIDDAAGLLWLANTGAIEVHLWTCRVPDLDHPDQAVFDLDPGDRATFDAVRQAALALRSELERVGLRGYPKMSGGRRLHVHVPLALHYPYVQVREWVKAVAARLVRARPDLLAEAHGRTHAGPRVTIDYAQNSVGRNTAAPYTLRARPGAPAAAPLAWDELERGLIQPSDLTLRTMPSRLARHGDAFASMLEERQLLPEEGRSL
jgi:bifunctional non-homologous end joining protein LigD